MQNSNPWREIEEQLAAFEAREATLRELWKRVVLMAAEIEQEYNKHNFEVVQWWRTEMPGMDIVLRQKAPGVQEVCDAPHYHMLRMTENSVMPETIVFRPKKTDTE